MGRKQARPKVRGKKEVYDEWEHIDIDRDDQKAGLNRREKRWKEIQLAQHEETKLEKFAIDNVEKMKRGIKGRGMTPLEEAWLRCDFLLSHIMAKKAYEFMEWQRLNDPACYKHLYKNFMSKNMMHNAQAYVDYFAKGGKPWKLITFGIVVRAYKKYKGIKSEIRVVHKGEKDREL